MKKLLVAFAAVAAFSAHAETITVAASPVPHAEILEFVKPALAKEGVAQRLALGREHQREEGLALLRAAAEDESAVPAVYGPPPMAKPSWELLGEQLLADGRKQEAAEAFGRALAFAPGRRLSQLGMEAALEP